MPDRAAYNSRDSRCKSPYGAVPSGTKVQLTLRPLRAKNHLADGSRSLAWPCSAS